MKNISTCIKTAPTNKFYVDFRLLGSVGLGQSYLWVGKTHGLDWVGSRFFFYFCLFRLGRRSKMAEIKYFTFTELLKQPL